MTMQSQAERVSFESSYDSSSAEEVESPRSVVSSAVRGGAGRLKRWRKGGTIGGDHNNSNNNSNNNNNNNSHNNSKNNYMHSQVLRIKEEEQQIGEEYLVGDYYGDNNNNNSYVGGYHMLDDDHDRLVIWARSMLPASPLGGRKRNNNIRSN